ncbi:DUF551 domain-containing protein [Klebsiella aerogenes]
MTNNQLTREWLQGRIANMECYGVVGDEALILQVYRMALAAMDSEPVMPEEMTPQQASRSYGGEVRGYRDGWNACRAAMLQAGNFRENSNSLTNNFREIAETSTSTAITPAAPDKQLTDDVLDEIIAGAKTSMEQYLALSLKAEREAWRQRQPTDDERIMAIEGINNCERCGDEGWIVGEMGITHCACSQDGTLTGEGTKQVEPVTTANKLPKTEFKQVADLYEMQFDDGRTCAFHTDAERAAQWLNAREGHKVQEYVKLERLHDAVSGNSPVIPDTWIPVSERMPEDEQEVLTINRMGHRFVSFFDKHSGLFFDRIDVPAACCIEHVLVTHWQPLPAAPQEVKTWSSHYLPVTRGDAVGCPFNREVKGG